jgi:phosphoenolpyruvate-protein kinase (PTS system EI component)
MNPSAIPFVKQIVRNLNKEETKQIAQTALMMESPDQIREWLEMKTPL